MTGREGESPGDEGKEGGLASSPLLKSSIRHWATFLWVQIHNQYMKYSDKIDSINNCHNMMPGKSIAFITWLIFILCVI